MLFINRMTHLLILQLYLMQLQCDELNESTVLQLVQIPLLLLINPLLVSQVMPELTSLDQAKQKSLGGLVAALSVVQKIRCTSSKESADELVLLGVSECFPSGFTYTVLWQCHMSLTLIFQASLCGFLPYQHNYCTFHNFFSAISHHRHLGDVNQCCRLM